MKKYKKEKEEFLQTRFFLKAILLWNRIKFNELIRVYKMGSRLYITRLETTPNNTNKRVEKAFVLLLERWIVETLFPFSGKYSRAASLMQTVSPLDFREICKSLNIVV